jgi:hypothetical protein
MTPAERAVIAAAVRWWEDGDDMERADVFFAAVAKLVKERKRPPPLSAEQIQKGVGATKKQVESVRKTARKLGMLATACTYDRSGFCNCVKERKGKKK